MLGRRDTAIPPPQRLGGREMNFSYAPLPVNPASEHVPPEFA